ncbi:helix-turn-helix domain-containing protein [Chitinophaga solisilvae]|uniref:helix-turn-helix domain-containing protein n=1 Tax=Chitinophaga solisilvae TaxID=1233460 RepID=UPI00136E096B|nr:helix-turn-helix domain-containing protein [Chitinophaga solisilvae]
MNSKVVPVFDIRQHCADQEIQHMKIAAFSEEACTIAEFEENHRHGYYEIIWLKKGKGIHHIDMMEYPYAGAVLFLLSPGQMHQIRPEDKADGYVIKFLPALFPDARDQEDYLLPLFDNIQAAPVVAVTSATHQVFEELFRKMEAEFHVTEEDKERILLSYLKILLTHISRLKRNQQSMELTGKDLHLRLFRDYKAAVEKNFRREHAIRYYASLLHTQVRTLNALAKKYTGKTAGQVIADRILLEARRELYHNQLSIKEIGASLGFEDAAYFTRFFKKQTGVPPKEYKI